MRLSLRVSASGYTEETREGVKPGANLTIRLDPGADVVVPHFRGPITRAALRGRKLQSTATRLDRHWLIAADCRQKMAWRELAVF